MCLLVDREGHLKQAGRANISALLIYEGMLINKSELKLIHWINVKIIWENINILAQLQSWEIFFAGRGW